MLMKVLLTRGLPGSGKSTYTSKLSPHQTYRMVSADHFFNQPDGTWQFDSKKIGEAHKRCFLDFTEIVSGRSEQGQPDVLIVDNTNIMAYELAPYIQFANAYNIPHEIITIWCDPLVASKRNIHKVPINTIFQMYQRLLKEELPPFWQNTVVLAE